jgi:DNA adenine methylase
MIRYNSTTRIYHRPLIKWPGGKARQSRMILETMIPSHSRFLDVCVGGATVPLNKPKVRTQILSDINPDLINLYQQVQKSGKILAHLVELTEPSKEVWKSAQRQELNDPLHRAFSFLINNRMSFRAYGRGCFEPNNHWHDLPRRIIRAQKRLRSYKILEANLFDQIKGARSSKFIFIDPPYLDQYYDQHGTDFRVPQHIRLLEMVVKSKGKILICGNESDLYNSYLGKWHCTRRPLHIRGSRTLTECFWRNYND